MKLQSFISSLLSIESFSFLNILYFNTIPDLQIYQNTTNLPRVIFHLTPNVSDDQVGLICDNGVFYKVIPFQKLFFNSNIFSIIFVSREYEFDTNYLSILNFQEDSKLLVIFADSIDFEAASILIRAGFLNIILLSAQDFEESQEFFTFGVFPSVKTIRNKYASRLRNPYLNHLGNLHTHYLKVLCPNDIPNCMYPEDGNQDFGGIMLKIILDFYRITNCYLSIAHSSDLKEEGLKNLEEYDIYGITVFTPPVSFEENYVFFQQSSYPLDFLDMLIAVPSPKPIHPSLYPFRPFSLEIWIAIASVILYSTLLVKLSAVENVETGDYFTRTLRLALAQSISFNHNHPVLSLFYVLNSLFGFVISLWYGAILGSFMSTYLKESPITCIEDLRSREIEIIHQDLMDYNFNLTLDLTLIYDNWDLFTAVSLEDASELLNTMDDSFAYLEDSNHWNYFMRPQMKFYRDPKLRCLDVKLGTSYLSIYFKFNTVFQSRFNRLIFLLKDVGLYQHYSESVFIHNLNHHFVNHTEISPTAEVQVLTLTYFSKVFVGWSLGIGISSLVFLYEILCMNLRINWLFWF